MASLLQKRISALETCLPDLDLPETRINIMVEDGRRDPPDPQPEELFMVVVSGTHCQSGRVFHRGHDESEQDFLNRVQK